MTPIGGRVSVAALSADGRWLATGAETGGLRLWRVPDSPEFVPMDTPVFEFHNHWAGVGALAFSADGRLLAAGGGDQTIRVWDVRDGRILAVLNGHDGGITRLVLTPDERTLVSTGRDGRVCLWDLSPERLALRPRYRPPAT